MLLPVPAGFSRTEIKFVRTWDPTVGIVVSPTTVLAFVLLIWFFDGGKYRLAAMNSNEFRLKRSSR